MSSRKVLVLPQSATLAHGSTRVLHRYGNGTALVETDAPVPEAGDSTEVESHQGLQLNAPGGANPGVTHDLQAMMTAYVEFIAQPDPKWLKQLQEHSITVISYQPVNSYLCLGSRAAFMAARDGIMTTEGLNAISGVVDVRSDMKPSLSILSEAGEEVVVVLAATSDQRAAVQQDIEKIDGVEVLQGAGNDVLSDTSIRLRARVKPAAHAQLLTLPRVLAVEPFVEPLPEDEVAGLIIAGLYNITGQPLGSYSQWLQGNHLDGAGTTIGIVDGGIDTSHPAFTGRVRDFTGGRKDWHATMVAGHAAGRYLNETDGSGFIYGLGTAPQAKLLSQDKMRAASELCRETALESGFGSAIQNNSWGKGAQNPMDYGSDEALYDALVRDSDPQGAARRPLTICFSSGNMGPRGLTRPKAAKNVIVTGNSESFRPDVGNIDSDNIDEVYSSDAHGSSYGNCGDGRIRPHVVAPGEWTASANYDSHPGEEEFISPLLTWGGGSSGASPKTAGACSLVSQWWSRNNGGRSPSPAMLRALLVNGAVPIATGGPAPNNRQGWGRLNVQNIVNPSVSRICVDQTLLLAQPGETQEWIVRAVDPSLPVKITLAWTDPPGAIGTGTSSIVTPIVNQLALRAEVSGKLYRGVSDRFRQGFSKSDSELAGENPGIQLPEGHDNLQNIFLEAGSMSATSHISVTALNITTNCLTGQFDVPQQDFALVISNARVELGSPPSLVAVATDKDLTSAVSTTRDHRTGLFGNDDPAELNSNSATGMKLNSGSVRDGTRAPGPTAPPSCSDNESSWWSAAGEPEGDHGRSTPINLDHLNAAMDAGFEMLARAGYKAYGAGFPIDRQWTVNQREHATLPLSEAIAGLQVQLSRKSLDQAPGQFAAVLVASAASRVTITDVHALRALSTAGSLYVVTESSDLAAFLAQQIGPISTVVYRIASSPTQTPALLLDAMAEAVGMSPLLQEAHTLAESGETFETEYSFDIVGDDTRVIIRTGTERDVSPTRLVLLRGEGSTPLTWPDGVSDGQLSDDVQISSGSRNVEMLVAGAGSSPGRWTVKVSADQTAGRPWLKVWAAGGLALTARQTSIAVRAEVDHLDRRLLQISVDSGGVIHRASIQSLARAEGAPVDELMRDIDVRRRPSRLDRREVGAEAERSIPVAALGTIIDLPLAPSKVVVLDVPIDVYGTDSVGAAFGRRTRLNIFQLPPSAESQSGPSPSTFVCGTITGFELFDGLVRRLRIAHAPHTRLVSVVSPQLAASLATWNYDNIGRETFVFEVRGDELHSLFLQTHDS